MTSPHLVEVKRGGEWGQTRAMGRGVKKKRSKKIDWFARDPSGFPLTPEHHLSLCSFIYLVCSK